jgi:hypothetical protein
LRRREGDCGRRREGKGRDGGGFIEGMGEVKWSEQWWLVGRKSGFLFTPLRSVLAGLVSLSLSPSHSPLHLQGELCLGNPHANAVPVPGKERERPWTRSVCAADTHTIRWDRTSFTV